MLRYFLWVVCFYVVFSLNSLGVEITPLTFRFSLERNITQELNVINGGDESVRYRVSVMRPDNQSNPNLYMGDWVRYYPKILSVPPKSSRVVRFRVNAPEGLEDGEYRAYLALEEIPKKEEDIKKMSEKAAEEEEEDNSDEEMGVFLHTRMGFRMALYGEIGKIQPKIEFQNLNLSKAEDQEKLEISGKILNKGNVSVKSIAIITFEDPQNKKSLETREVVLPVAIRDNNAEFNIPFEKPEGNFRIAEIKIHHWTPEKVGDLIEQKKLSFN